MQEKPEEIRTRNNIAKEKIQTVCFFLIFTSMWAIQITDMYDSTILAYIINTFLIVIIISVNIKNKVSLNLSKNFVLLECIAVCMIIMGIRLHLLGNVAEGLVLGILFPILAVFTQKEMGKTIVDIISKAMSYSFYLLVLLSLLMAPLGDIRYRGVLTNSNSFAAFTVTVLMLSVYVLLFTCNTKRHKCYYFMTAVLACDFIIISESRAALLSMGVCLIFWSIYCIFILQKHIVWKKFICLFICVALFLPIVLSGLKYIPQVAFHLEETIIGSSIIIYDFQDNSESFSYDANGKIMIENRLTDTTSSGRTTLWKLYYEKIGFNGHNVPVEYDGQTRTSHNAYIQVAYSSGILCGILLLIFNLATSIVAIKRWLSDKHNQYYAQRVIIMIVYGAYSMIETIYFPYSHHIAFLFWIVACSMLDKSAGNNRK